jgi:hypothetical protein
LVSYLTRSQKGLPDWHTCDHGTPESFSSLEVHRRRRQGPIRRLARPGTTLGSNARVGMRIRVAASMAGRKRIRQRRSPRRTKPERILAIPTPIVQIENGLYAFGQVRFSAHLPRPVAAGIRRRVPDGSRYQKNCR